MDARPSALQRLNNRDMVGRATHGQWIMMTTYRNAIVVVTGASTGLGRAIALGAAAAGARAVIINFRQAEDDAKATALKVAALGAEAILVRGDVGNDDDCRAVANAAERFGRIDTLFNNAGTMRSRSFTEFTGEDFIATYLVNVVGALQMARAARTLLEAAGGGAIVNTSSLAALTGRGSSLAYTASKGALNAIGKALAIELAPRIRVNTICPGFIDTEWFDKQAPSGGTEQLRQHIRRSTALQAVSMPEDVAEAALFLGSRAARHITGEILTVDAGLGLGPPNR